MDYFSYLTYTKQKDTQSTFEKYLVEILGYTTQEAEKTSRIYYKSI